MPQMTEIMYWGYIHRKAFDSQCDDIWQKYHSWWNKIDNTIKFENYEYAIINNMGNPKSVWKIINQLLKENRHNVMYAMPYSGF